MDLYINDDVNVNTVGELLVSRVMQKLNKLVIDYHDYNDKDKRFWKLLKFPRKLDFFKGTITFLPLTKGESK